MSPNNRPRKPSTLKNDLLNGLCELAIGAVILGAAFGLAILFPQKNVDFEFYLLMAGLFSALVGGIVFFVHIMARELKKSKVEIRSEVGTDDYSALVYPAHQMKLRPAPFAAIQSGHKTVELRLNDEKRQKIKVGDTIVFTQTETEETLRAVVSDIRQYPDFEALYQAEDPLAIGYTEGETADPIDMNQYYNDDEIRRYGVLAVEIRRMDP